MYVYYFYHNEFKEILQFNLKDEWDFEYIKENEDAFKEFRNKIKRKYEEGWSEETYSNDEDEYWLNKKYRFDDSEMNKQKINKEFMR